MGIIDYVILAAVHPIEFRSLVQYKLFFEGARDIAATKEHPTSGWNRETMRECWGFLDKTSRSFAAVIKQLDGDLARTVRVWAGAALLTAAYDVGADLHVLPRPSRLGHN